MSCDRRCFNPDDPMFEYDNCATCPGRDSLTMGDKDAIANGFVPLKQKKPVRPQQQDAKIIRPNFGSRRENNNERELAERIKRVVYEYAEQVSVAQVLGILEVVKIEILEEQADG